MHEPWQSQLPLYVAGVLSPEDRDAVEAHLATCEACRARVHDWERIGAAVRSELAARVEGISLPPLRDSITRPHSEAAMSRNGRSSEQPAWGTLRHVEKESEEMSIITARTTQREWWPHVPRPRLAPTLIAALLMVALFGGALLLFNARQGDTPAAPGAPSGGDGSQPAAIQSTATETATPLPSATPVPEQPDNANATPLPPTAVPPQGAEAMPPAGEPLQGIITATPVPFEAQAIELLPTALPPMVPPAVSLEGVRYEAQGWNNAGPATLAMALSVYGWDGNQQTAARWLKPDSEDKSVSPWQMVAYVNGQTPFQAIYRVGGTLDMLKSAVAAGFPVIAAVEMDIDSEGWFGHYQLVTGYDESAGVLLVYDSYLGPTTEPRRVPFSEFDAAWWPFNRTFVVVFPPDRAADAQVALLGYGGATVLEAVPGATNGDVQWTVVGTSSGPAYGAQMALDAALRATADSPEDVWGWFNLGTVYTMMGRFEDAAAAYDRALEMGLPFRALWYQFGPFEAYFGAGRYDDVLALCASMLDVTPYVEEVYYWQALAHAAQGDVEAASRALEQLIALNPNFLVGELARFQAAPDALAPEMLPPVTVVPPGAPALPLASDTPVPTIVPPVTVVVETPIRVELTPTLPPTLTPSGTPIMATPIRVEPTPTLPPTLPPTSTPIPGS